ncbi:hypothetical protein [Paenibacillus ferrarius]|uniref:hypothetical protein n=1 Tax=Paenibacillus ferrarius TaxID=1469647 RepID=UPI003D2CBDFB
MPTLSMKSKKWLLSLHILFSAILLGTSVVFLILSITAAASNDAGLVLASYRSMHVLSDTSIRASTIGTTVTGILLSVWTHWGLFKYRWIISKEVLTLLVILIGPFGMHVWTLRGITLLQDTGIGGATQGAYVSNSLMFFAGIGIQIVALVAMYLLSVFKPGGKRGRT